MVGLQRLARTWVPAGLSLAFMIGAALLVWGWFFGDNRTGELAERGADTTGTVIAVTKSAGSISKYGTANPARFYVTYSFMDSIGTPHEAMTNGTSEAYAGLAPGKQIAVRYLPDDPQVSIYASGIEPMASDAQGKLLLLLLGAAALSGYYAFSGFREGKTRPHVANAPR